MLEVYRQAIEEFYGDRRAKRSNVLLMNHINEGIKILEWRSASDDAKAAFMIHPIFQNDKDLGSRQYIKWIGTFSQNVILLAMEYRHIANSYLPKHETRTIILSCLDEVNEMLIADKVQNRKDFLLYNNKEDSHSRRLNSYFDEWLTALNISDDQYKDYTQKLILNS